MEGVRPRWVVLYVGVLVCLSVGFLIRWPIVAGDTDVWYHLNAGRYLVEHHAIPQTSFFSFIPRDWVDYYWLFQGVVYLLYSWWGYYGLIAFRALLYLATIALIAIYLFRTVDHDEAHGWSAVILTLYGLVLLPRALLVRPHLVTYLFMVVFLVILERHPRQAKYLPVLAVLWCNLHGIAYPVMLWLAGSYALEYFITRLTGRVVPDRPARAFLLPTVLSMVAIYLTPHGTRLLGVPFASMSYAGQFIQEFHPIALGDLASFQISRFTPSYLTVFNLLVLAACAAFISAIVNRQIRISHFLLLGGGLFLLLTRGVRFMDEFALLALPLINANPLRLVQFRRQVPRPMALFFIVLMMAMPLKFLAQLFGHRPAYPFSHRGLPHGVATFLNHLDVGGAVFNHPDTGGYLQWALPPRYRIFMDMQVPFLFTAEDFYLARSAFMEQGILAKIVSRYDPSFITAPYTHPQFPEMIRQFPQFELVFFDDAEVLYLNAQHNPALAKQYALKAVDPFALRERSTTLAMTTTHPDPVLGEVSKLFALYPDCGITNYSLALAYHAMGSYDRVLPFAEAIIRNFPESPTGYWLKGRAYQGLRAFDQAQAAYLQALQRAESSTRMAVSNALGTLYLEHRRYQQAYEAFKKSFDIFSPTTTREELYNLGSSARLAGKRKEAEAILTYVSEYKIPPDDTAWREQVRRELVQLGVHLDE